jgi:hypothetical protein
MDATGCPVALSVISADDPKKFPFITNSRSWPPLTVDLNVPTALVEPTRLKISKAMVDVARGIGKLQPPLAKLTAEFLLYLEELFTFRVLAVIRCV